MYVILGLGNPGEQYANTKHNIGFDVVDLISAQLGHSTNDFSVNNPLQSVILETAMEGKKVILAKPTKFMNNSGLAVSKLIKSYEAVPEDVIVIHDDVTIDLGTIKISKGKSAANHNGVQSVIDHIKTDEFVRVRLGIGRGKGVMSDVVLSRFSAEEMDKVNEMKQNAAKACEMVIKSGIEKAMNELN